MVPGRASVDLEPVKNPLSCLLPNIVFFGCSISYTETLDVSVVLSMIVFTVVLVLFSGIIDVDGIEY